MYLQNGYAAIDIGKIDIHLPVEAAGTQQGGIQYILTVGGSHHDDPLVGGKAIHLNQ
ncbi:hypothetical protein SDC9_128029 [bioreactor metagenome]|uniref:Uncharacterized protein n=1 Tax=bioreactor metagenome TaxID=1076179 RepID=A0A645CVV1_9ZZZZ